MSLDPHYAGGLVTDRCHFCGLRVEGGELILISTGPGDPPEYEEVFRCLRCTSRQISREMAMVRQLKETGQW